MNKQALEQESLSYPDLFNYLADLGFKAHIQHTISFIQNKIGASPQVCFPGF